MTPDQKTLVSYYGGLPQASGILDPSSDLHWAKLFAWGRGETFRLSTPLHAAKDGCKWIQSFSKSYGTCIMMPLTLLTGVFGMNFTFPPWLVHHGLWLSSLFMTLLAVAMLIYLRNKRWL